MKKKIKDLSIEEMDKICSKHKCNKECPLFVPNHKELGETCYAYMMNYDLQNFLLCRTRKEVEVDE